jgi:hydroxymethylpyrimidine pyrophosphatase-like HAD family hydrolase
VATGSTIKLTVRHPSMSAKELQDFLDGHNIAGCHTTTSGAPFLEVGGDTVNKASGLQLLCDQLGVSAAEVMAFGDADNDIEMLTWAGRSVAMGNATEHLKSIAAAVTGPNTADGVGTAVEALLAERKQRWNRSATPS